MDNPAAIARGPRAGAQALFLAVVIVIVVVVAAAVYAACRRARFTLLGTTAHPSRLDGLRYRVHREHADRTAAADTMAEINRRTIALLRRLRAEYRGAAAATYPERAHAVERLLARYNPDNLAENSPRDPSGDTSYTIGKGDVLALCLRERDPLRAGDPRLYDIHDLNTLMFVMVHELTHVAILDLDHPPRFWRAFKFLLAESVKAGVLDPVNYDRLPEEYCGMSIDYSPLHDQFLDPIV
jgi:hypothetical protein